MKILTLALLVVVVHGCADDSLNKGAAAPGGPCSYEVHALDIAPSVVVRGVATTLTIHWRLGGAVAGVARAQLIVGPGNQIEVDVPLNEDTLDVGTFVGSLLNPFGVGAPAGDGTVLAEARSPPECDQPLSATSSFYLE